MEGLQIHVITYWVEIWMLLMEVFKTIYTDAGKEFGNKVTLFCASREIYPVRFGPTTGKKTRLGIL